MKCIKGVKDCLYIHLKEVCEECMIPNNCNSKEYGHFPREFGVWCGKKQHLIKESDCMECEGNFSLPLGRETE